MCTSLPRCGCRAHISYHCCQQCHSVFNGVQNWQAHVRRQCRRLFAGVENGWSCHSLYKTDSTLSTCVNSHEICTSAHVHRLIGITTHSIYKYYHNLRVYAGVDHTIWPKHRRGTELQSTETVLTAASPAHTLTSSPNLCTPHSPRRKAHSRQLSCLARTWWRSSKRCCQRGQQHGKPSSRWGPCQ